MSVPSPAPLGVGETPLSSLFPDANHMLWGVRCSPEVQGISSWLLRKPLEFQPCWAYRELC